MISPYTINRTIDTQYTEPMVEMLLNSMPVRQILTRIYIFFDISTIMKPINYFYAHLHRRILIPKRPELLFWRTLSCRISLIKEVKPADKMFFIGSQAAIRNLSGNKDCSRPAEWRGLLDNLSLEIKWCNQFLLSCIDLKRN